MKKIFFILTFMYCLFSLSHVVPSSMAQSAEKVTSSAASQDDSNLVKLEAFHELIKKNPNLFDGVPESSDLVGSCSTCDNCKFCPDCKYCSQCPCPSGDTNPNCKYCSDCDQCEKCNVFCKHGEVCCTFCNDCQG